MPKRSSNRRNGRLLKVAERVSERESNRPSRRILVDDDRTHEQRLRDVVCKLAENRALALVNRTRLLVRASRDTRCLRPTHERRRHYRKQDQDSGDEHNGVTATCIAPLTTTNEL